MLKRRMPPHPRLLFLFFPVFFPGKSCIVCLHRGLKPKRSCGEFRTPYLTLGNCNLSWEEGVSLGDLPQNNYSHDKAINQAAPLPARLLLLLWGRILDLFAVMLSRLGRTPLARKPHGGAVLSAVGPAGAGIPTQPDGPHVEIIPKCSKDQRDLNVTHRWLLNAVIVIECDQINEICSLFKDAKEAPKSKIN